MDDIPYQDDTFLTDMERKVLEVISIYNRPVTVREIAEEINMPQQEILRLFKHLLKKGNIVEYSSEHGKQRYYSPTLSKTGLDAVLSQKYADFAGSLEKQYAEVKAENENLRQQIEKMYANILTLMGIFVAIFSLIIINVDAIGSFITTADNSDALFLSLLKLNIPLVISIAVLLVLIKILFSPKQKK